MSTQHSVVPKTIEHLKQVITGEWQRFLVLTILALVVTGCATGHVTQMSDEKIHGPKVIALYANNAPWLVDIQGRLKQAGFKVLRWSSREAEARYILEINGQAPINWGRRCIGGGYKFDYLDANLVDVETNETILNINGKGYSENCPPLSGSIFQDIVDAVKNAWQ
jgi:hypothetical protein